MNCENCILLLDEYLNNELEENFRGSVSAHLGDCEDCRMEIRFLESEIGFYQKIADRHKNNLPDQWEAMRKRLVAESIIKGSILPKIKESESRSPVHFFSGFFIQLKNLFPANRIAFGTLLLIIFGFAGIFLLKNPNNPVDDKNFIASSKSKEISNPKAVLNSPENDISQPEKDTNEPKVIDKSNSAAQTFQTSQTTVDKKKPNISVNSKKGEKLKLQIKPLENAVNTSSKYIAVHLPVEDNESDFQTTADDKKMTSYLNKVHLFLLLVRNLENDETINAVIGDKYQTEARLFLDINNNYKKESLNKKNIPAVELLNEIEPVLKAISKLDKQNGQNGFGNVTAMVKQTGIVFKMRLWMSNTKSEKEKSL